MGFRYYVDLHVVVRGDLTVRQGHLIAHAVADQVRAQVDELLRFWSTSSRKKSSCQAVTRAS